MYAFRINGFSEENQTGHWYDQTGNYITGVKGKMPAAEGHLHPLQLKVFVYHSFTRKWTSPSPVEVDWNSICTVVVLTAYITSVLALAQ